jgi:hypothetical protein
MTASGDVGAELAALAVQSGEAQRRTSRDIRDALEDSVESQENQQVDALRAKAADTFASSLIEGLGTAAEGGCQLGASFATCDAVKLKWNASGTLAQGVAKMGSALYAQNAVNDDANATSDASAADRAKRAIQDTGDAYKDAGDYVNAAIDFYREYVSAQGQTMNAALHRA